MDINKAVIIGNLTRDPELRSLPSGTKVCSFALATNRVWKDKNGARQEDAQYHNIVVFGLQAELVNQYLRKGNTALVEGRMQTRSWDGPDGKKNYRTEVVADRVQFGPKNAGGGFSGAPVPAATPPAGGSPAPKDNPPTIQYPDEEINPDDIPF